MKIAASDYDGTLFRQGRISREDLEAIEAWRAGGNLFGLATGRDLGLIRNEIESRHIPFDFIICNTGAAVYDGSYTPVSLTALPPKAATAVMDHKISRASRYCLFSRGLTTYIKMQTTESWLTGMGLPLTPINPEDARQLIGLHQIGLEYETPELSRQSVLLFNNDYGDTMHAEQSGFCLDIVAAGVSKASGLAAFIDLLKLSPEKMLTVGDSENDLSMLRQYQGYAMSGASDEVKQAAVGVVNSPADVLWAHLEN